MKKGHKSLSIWSDSSKILFELIYIFVLNIKK
jgi:hypothetical protein